MTSKYENVTLRTPFKSECIVKRRGWLGLHCYLSSDQINDAHAFTTSDAFSALDESSVIRDEVDIGAYTAVQSGDAVGASDSEAHRSRASESLIKL